MFVMRSILLHVHKDPGLEARLQVALDMAREFNGHLTCLQPISFDFAVPGDLYGTMVAELVPAVRESADATRDRIRARLAGEDAAWDWQQQEGPARALLQRAAGLADLVVLGTRDPAGGGKGPSSLNGYMALYGRSPIMVVPEAMRAFDLSGTAVIGWNGSPEAAHALRGALPLLGKASSVMLLNVTENSDDPGAFLSALDGAEYLSRHGVACEIVDVDRGSGTVARALLDSAAARSADYLVVGAYGHARAVEMVFGGVTRELLSDPPLPIFTAH
jgi:nucleotide-binding universal stress UspA family protein